MSEQVDQPPILPPPFVNIPGIANFRDIGGYTPSTKTHQSTRHNLVYRSADPSKVTPDGLAKLKELGVNKVFDLRSIPEIHKQGPEWAGVEVEKADVFYVRPEGSNEPIPEGEIERVWCPVFRDKDYGPEQVAVRFSNYARSGNEGFVQAYKDILLSGTDAYKTILHHLSQPSPSPCIIHCTAGKDRTGVLIALLLLLCHIPTSTVADEYSLTDQGLQHLVPLFTERLLKNPALEGNREGVANMICARPEKMGETIKMMEEMFGGAEGYVRDWVGLSEEEVEAIRRNLLVDA